MRYYKLSLYLTLIIFAISVNAVPPLLSTLSNEYALPAWTLGVGITLQFISFFTISWWGNQIGQQHNVPHHIMILQGLFFLTAALALAPFILSSLPAVFLWMCIIGLAGGLVETFSSISLMENSHSASSKSLCLSQAFYALGAFIAPQTASFFLVRSGGWESTFYIFGALTMTLTLFFMIFIKRNAWTSIQTGKMNTSYEVDQISLVGEHSVIFFRILIFIYVTVEALCGSWMPYMLENRLGLSTGKAAFMASFFWFGMIAGRVTVAFLPDRLKPLPTITISAILSVIASFVILIIPGYSLLALTVFGLAMGPIWPITVSMTGLTLRSSTLTASVIATGGLGAATGPLIGSLLIAEGLAHLYFHVITIFCLLVAVIISLAFIKEKRIES